MSEDIVCSLFNQPDWLFSLLTSNYKWETQWALVTVPILRERKTESVRICGKWDTVSEKMIGVYIKLIIAAIQKSQINTPKKLYLANLIEGTSYAIITLHASIKVSFDNLGILIQVKFATGKYASTGFISCYTNNPL